MPWYPFEDASIIIPSRVYWRSEHPLEIVIVFGTTVDEADNPDYNDPDASHIRWVFSRELLTEARMKGKAGIGDVHVEITRDTMFLTLTSPFGEVKLRTVSRLMEEFIRRTYEVTNSEAEEGAMPLTDIELQLIVREWEGKSFD
jgi:hypothetical protein